MQGDIKADPLPSEYNYMPSDQYGPLIRIYAAAASAGTLALGSYDQFAEDTGVPLVGSPTEGQCWVVALLDEDTSGSMKVASRLSVVRFARDDATAAPTVIQFEGGEHTAIGDSISLFLNPDDPLGMPAYRVQLVLPNGLRLTYGQILALGGDFYGVPDKPISDGPDFADQMLRFTNAYNTLATNHASVAEAPQILGIMQVEITAVNEALNRGEPASDVYNRLGDRLNVAWNEVTGGGYIAPLIPPGRYLKLAETNWDHFGNYAILSYKAGHTVALTQAIGAFHQRERNPEGALVMLMQAYAMNAFADHFLSDLFSAGHIRNPRKEIYATAQIGLTANLCAKGMHDEDCRFGLVVSSSERVPTIWRAYGDKRYFDTVNLENKALVIKAVQASADEVFQAYCTGEATAPTAYLGLALAPNVAEAQDYRHNPQGNFSPLLVLDNRVVQRREALNDLNDRHWYAPLGWGDLAAALHSPLYNPNNPTGYISPPDIAPVISPTGWARNQPLEPNWVPGNQVRYFVSFASNNFESTLSPPCPWVTLMHQFQPLLTNIPIGRAGTLSRRIYREFHNDLIRYCGTIADNITTNFQDLTP